MKKQLILFVLIGLALNASGQKKDTLRSSEFIDIDPFGVDRIPNGLKLGTTIKCRISNVNTFLLSGDLSSKSETIDFAIPTVFAPASDKANETTGGEVDKNLKEATLTLEKTNFEIIRLVKENKGKKTNKIKQLEEARKKLEAEYKLLKHRDSLITAYKEAFSSFVTDFNNIHQFLALEEKLKAKLRDSLFIRDIATLKQNAEDDYKVLYGNGLSVSNKAQVSLPMDRLVVGYANLRQIYDELNKTLEKDSVSVSGTLKSSEAKTTVDIKNAMIKQDRKKYFSEEMIYAKGIFETITDIEKRNKIIKKAQEGVDLYNRIKNETFVAYSVSEQLNADIVTITPQLKYGNGKVAQEFSPIELRTSGGWKVNFSSGYMLSFIGDDNYGLLKDSAGTSIGAVKSNSSNLTHALGGFIHAYPRCANPSLPQLALSGGVSMSAGGTLGFYGGLSAMFLEKNRLVFTFGYSYVKVNRLNSANLNTMGDNRYQFRSTSDNTINYDQVYRGACFFGLTYNLSK